MTKITDVSVNTAIVTLTEKKETPAWRQRDLNGFWQDLPCEEKQIEDDLSLFMMMMMMMMS